MKKNDGERATAIQNISLKLWN